MELHASSFILDEVGCVLRHKFGWEEERAGRAVAQVRRVTGGIHEPPESVIEDDPTNSRILECALAAEAEFVVTGDKKHLLPLGSFRGLSIVGLADLLASFYSGPSLSASR